MIKIFCAHCKKHIYNYMLDIMCCWESFSINCIEPANDDIKQPQVGEDMRCPLCNKMFTSEKGILTDQGYFPKYRGIKMAKREREFDGFSIKIYVDDDGDWLAHFIELPNISACGDTIDEALQELKDAWEGTKESYRKHGEKVPVMNKGILPK